MFFEKILLKTFVFLLTNIFFISGVEAQQLAPPKFNVTDKHGVNIHSGQVTTSVDTVSIGGVLGLSHRLQSHTSNFLVRNAGGATTGLSDKFGGSAKYTRLRSVGEAFINLDLYSSYNPNDHFRDTQSGIYVMKVHDHESTADFKIMLGSYARGDVTNSSASYFYEALGDKRHKLERPAQYPGYLLWTKPDGTQVWFSMGLANTDPTSGGVLEKIIYPNGLTLYLTRTSGAWSAVTDVTSNTGYQLKYNYLHEPSINRGVGSGSSSTEIPPENNYTWSRQNPHSIVAINTAIERCSSDRAKLCVGYQQECPSLYSQQGQVCTKFNNSWPTAKFNWPLGMPRAVYFGETIFSVVDSSSRTTDFRIKAFDKYMGDNGGPISPAYSVGVAFVPRLVGVKPANSHSENITYTYRNYESGKHSAGYIMSMPGETGLVSGATGINGYQGYTTGFQPSQNPDSWARQGADQLSVHMRNELMGAMISVQSESGYLTFQQDYRNFPQSFASASAAIETYYYDARGNLNKIVYNSGTPTQTFVEASFPATCTNPKTCNQADWISDAKGNKTYYTYHPESGQIASITHPANKNNLKAETRFTYVQKYANYINDAGVKTQADTPIWLKSEERYCINSDPSGSGCMAGDEVVTRYEYIHDNLLLTGMTVTDQHGATLRTCYQYDIYGNRIAETQPKANLVSCN